ncbi:hypothetical protein E0Z10_g10095 [Xylaria hypoxylon]|uniref:Uncharacterized protein n=1 Tax=Xylaria hypoxylon TaxID=37992 RepID=A0A4Z0YHE8_9PEZI|nr:hypothetical protein E0Z10_g10095 [Xylaria hypoxylon]
MAIRTVGGLRIKAALLLTILLFVTSSSASITWQFQHFYPQHGDKYEYILHHNCSQEFANYLTGRPQDFQIDWLGGGGQYSVLVQPVVTCLLGNVSEYIKAAASSAQVILGVTPPILATLGASTDELAMLSVVGRRPLLALLISFGNPSVYMERVFDFRQPEKMLQRSRGRYRPYRPDTTFKRWVLAAMQYCIALGAAANVAALSWQLGVGTVCSWWSETVFSLLVWTVLSIPIHMAGTFALRLRMRRIYSDEDKEINIGCRQWLWLLPKRLHGFWKSEWVPAVCQDEIRTISFEEEKIYVAWSWLLSTATIIHILFGSLVLSGLLFIGPRDALLVIFRYVVSVLVCRILVTFELAGMRQRYVPEPEQRTSTEVVQMEDKDVRYRRGTREEEV